MNGAESLVKTLLASGVDTCFANPGTSEMHFVAALDRHAEMRCILCLFEGGASGAADGYYRMSGKVAATLLHLAPGFGNAFANLCNARKAQSGVVNVMGDHASYHPRHESPLKGDTVGISQAISHWTRVSRDAMAAVGAPVVGRNVMRMFDMVEPMLDWVALAKGHGVGAWRGGMAWGHGVGAVRVTTAEGFVEAFAGAIARKGPFLIAVEC